MQNEDKDKNGFIQNTKVFINRNLALTNKNTAFCGKNLKWSGLVQVYFTIDGMVCIKNQKIENLNLFDMKNLHELFPDFNFGVDEDLNP